MLIRDHLRSVGACDDAIEWAGRRRSIARAWAECPRGDWLLWYAATVGVDRRLVVLAACACARLSLVHVPAGEDRPRLAIEAAEAWARGDVGIEVAREAAANAASAAAASAGNAAAYAAANAAANAAACAYAAGNAAAGNAAAYAADANANAAAAASASAGNAAAYAAANSAVSDTIAQCADIVRSLIHTPPPIQRPHHDRPRRH